MASSTHRLKISPRIVDDDPLTASAGAFAAAAAGVPLGGHVERDLHAAVPGPTLRACRSTSPARCRPGRRRACARAGTRRRQEPRHRLRARLRKLPVRRKAQGADRGVVACVRSRRPALARRASASAMRPRSHWSSAPIGGFAGPEQPVAEDRHDAPVGAIVDGDEPAPDLVGQEWRPAAARARPAGARAAPGGPRARRRCPPRRVGGAAQPEPEAEVDADEEQRRDRAHDPQGQPAEPSAELAAGTPRQFGDRSRSYSPRCLRMIVEEPLPDRLELALTTLDDAVPALEARAAGRRTSTRGCRGWPGGSRRVGPGAGRTSHRRRSRCGTGRAGRAAPTPPRRPTACCSPSRRSACTARSGRR